MTELESGLGSISWRKIGNKTLQLHLFTDCVLVSRRRDGGRFSVFDHANSAHIRVEMVRVKGHRSDKNTFRLILRNSPEADRQYLLRAQSQ
eukprot:gi/632992104/ref/XP_007884924.1/ PREDICTED: rho guanine nucleotide exchange factor 19-like [Callorhinchus milii]